MFSVRVRMRLARLTIQDPVVGTHVARKTDYFRIGTEHADEVPSFCWWQPNDTRAFTMARPIRELWGLVVEMRSA